MLSKISIIFFIFITGILLRNLWHMSKFRIEFDKRSSAFEDALDRGDKKACAFYLDQERYMMKFYKTPFWLDYTKYKFTKYGEQ